MRAVILGLAGLVLVGEANAADYLRGSSYELPPSASYNWAGVYVGGQAGYAEQVVSLAATARTAVAPRLLRPTIETDAELAQWPALPRSDSRGSTYGGFIGYNSQWGDVVLGLELNYNRASLSTTSMLTRFVDTSAFPGGVSGSLGQVDHSSTVRITDYGSLRFRTGYAWNWLMPYGMVGVAMGRADLVRSATVSYPVPPAPSGPPPYGPYTDTETRNGLITFGYSAGLGVDIGLLPGVFVRGEYEFVQLNTIKGMTAHLSTFRAAAAVKF